MKRQEGAFLGIGFWAGMGVMSLITFCGSIVLVPNYYDARYGLVMLIISIIFVILGIILLHNLKRKKRK